MGLKHFLDIWIFKKIQCNIESNELLSIECNIICKAVFLLISFERLAIYEQSDFAILVPTGI